MLTTILLILLVIWLFGFAFNVAGGLIHILLICAIIIFIISLIQKR